MNWEEFGNSSLFSSLFPISFVILFIKSFQRHDSKFLEGTTPVFIKHIKAAVVIVSLVKLKDELISINCFHVNYLKTIIFNYAATYIDQYQITISQVTITKQLANELKDKNISVNAVCPGWVRKVMDGAGATCPVETGAETPVWFSTEASQNLTGLFFRDKKVISW